MKVAITNEDSGSPNAPSDAARSLLLTFQWTLNALRVIKAHETKGGEDEAGRGGPHSRLLALGQSGPLHSDSGK